METIRQKPSPLSQSPDPHPLTPEQWSILAAIADTVIADIALSAADDSLIQLPVTPQQYNAAAQHVEAASNGGVDATLVGAFLAEKATAQPEFREQLERLFAMYLPSPSRWQLSLVLSALGTSAGALLLTGYATPMDRLPVATRAQIIRSWATSRIGIQRRLARSFTLLTAAYWIRTSPTLNRLLAFPRTPAHEIPPHTVYKFEFIQIPASTIQEPETIETDVVIVGSGCGAAVSAKVLAEAGLRVVVAEKGYYWSPEHLPMSELEGFPQLFGNGGQYQSEDSNIAVLGGSTWGGGGTVNWSACLQTQGFVRKEWAEKFGLTHFQGAGFQADLDAVFERMGAGVDQIPHNKGNRSLLDGAKKLGWSAKPVAQNTGGEAHNCGYCTLGCGSCGKKHAIGVKGTWLSRDSAGGVAGADRFSRPVVIKARRVLIGAGPMETPLMLQRSGLTLPHIGKHLHLHPVQIVGAVWDEEIRPWEGPILSTVVNEFENLDGAGYGTKLECVTMLPGIFLPFFKWEGALAYKQFVSKMKNMTGYIALARDRYGGSVYADPKDGRPIIRYTTSKHDQAHILEGVIGIAKILYVEGAKEIFTGIQGVPPFERPDAALSPNAAAPSVNDPDFVAWVAHVRKTGFPAESTGFASAHQMGTTRMGTNPSNSVVDEHARVWGTENLYVVDTSVFPSASGVNPMVTVMAIAHGTARSIVAEELANGNVSLPTPKAKI